MTSGSSNTLSILMGVTSPAAPVPCATASGIALLHLIGRPEVPDRPMNGRFLDYAPVPAWRASLKSGIRRLGLGRGGDRGQFRPRAQPELGEDVLEMSLHRVAGQEQPVGDLGIGMTLSRQRHDPPLG